MTNLLLLTIILLLVILGLFMASNIGQIKSDVNETLQCLRELTKTRQT